MSDNNVVTIDQAYIIALNNYFKENYDETINILIQIIKKNNHIPSIFLYGYINIICYNISEGLNVFEQLLDLDGAVLDDKMKDRILKITSHFIYYPDIDMATNYPKIASLHRKNGVEF